MKNRYIPITFIVAVLAVAAIAGFLFPPAVQENPARIVMDNSGGRVFSPILPMLMSMATSAQTVTMTISVRKDLLPVGHVTLQRLMQNSGLNTRRIFKVMKHVCVVMMTFLLDLLQKRTSLTPRVSL